MEKKRTSLVIGIDDSGRGPVIGPMVLAGILIKKENERKFKKIGVKDSKLLTPKKRDKLLKQILEMTLDHSVITIFPTEIDGRYAVKQNLNHLEAVKSAQIINQLLEKNKKILEESEVSVIIDCPSVNIKKWTSYFKKYLNKDCYIKDFIIEHKADKNHVCVSAASILAKVTRDNEIDKIKKKIKYNFGSGYPSDPLTIKFLKKFSTKFKNDGIFRQTWSTWKNHIKEKEQKKLRDF